VARFDPAFWEIPIDPGVLDRLEAPPEFDEAAAADHEARAAALAEAAQALREIMTSALTDRQRAVLQRYYFDEQSQAEIAAGLGISQQAVSRHLFGVVRRGKRVGGATKKLRKALEQIGIDPKKWV